MSELSGLKFYTKGDGQKTIKQLSEISQVQEVSDFSLKLKRFDFKKRNCYKLSG